jgi:membrane protease YdiL (CAAX protease family)
MLVFGTWLAGRMEDRTLQAYGLPLKKIPVARFSEGAALGFAMLSLVLFPLALVGRFHVDSLALAGREAASYAAGWAFAFIALAIVEEFFFRGYLLYQVARRLKFWQAALLMSAVFGAAHLGNPGENVLGILHVAADGLLYCLMLRRTGNLWFGIGFHMAWDWAQTFFYGTLDSGLPGVGHLFNTHFNGPTWLTGGSSGPEGGILAFAATVIAAYIVHRRFPTAMYPDRPA